MIGKFIDRLVDIWLRKCTHLDVNVVSDILDGMYIPLEVKYCRRCGAVCHTYSTEWRRPRPLWFADE